MNIYVLGTLSALQRGETEDGKRTRSAKETGSEKLRRLCVLKAVQKTSLLRVERGGMSAKERKETEHWNTKARES